MKTTQPSLARYERGSQMPGNRFLIRIANALNTNVVAPTFECLEQRNKSVKNVELNNNSITDIRFVVTYDAHPQVTKSIAQASPSPYAQAFGLKPISTNNNQPII
jgi:transcriptional regulator with XRE-family HTH domain